MIPFARYLKLSAIAVLGLTVGAHGAQARSTSTLRNCPKK